MEMKDENKEFKAYFENFTPDADTTERMYKTVTARGTIKKTGSRRMWKLLLAAALSMTLAVFTVFAASPAVRKYFFPGVGIVEVPADTEEEAEPLYLVMGSTNTRRETFRCSFGYWHDGTLRIWLRQYSDTGTITLAQLIGEEAAANDSAVLYRLANNEYCLSLSGITAAEAKEGIRLEGLAIPFDRTPREYSAFTAENNGLRLTLIPLTETRSTFAYFLEYTDGRPGKLSLTNTMYNMANYHIQADITLVTNQGVRHPLKNYSIDGIHILTTGSTVYGIGVQVLCDKLFIEASFEETEEGALLQVPVPEKGEVLDLQMDFTFPDGTKGRLAKIGRNVSMVDFIPNIPELDYISYMTEFISENGFSCEYKLLYSSAFRDKQNLLFREYCQTLEEVPDEWKHFGWYSFQPRLGNASVPGDGYVTSYMDTGDDTVEFALTGYRAMLPGDWNFDLAVQPPEAE